MTDDINIYILNLSDLNLLSNNLTLDFDDFWSIDTLKSELKSENTYYICAKKNNTILGFAGIRYFDNTADLMNIVIKKDSRKLGLGSLLLETIIEFCKKDNDITSIMLEVNENNSNAIKLYEKYGFKKISIRKNYYKNDSAVIMRLSI